MIISEYIEFKYYGKIHRFDVKTFKTLNQTLDWIFLTIFYFFWFFAQSQSFVFLKENY